jgi:nitronate monooxygenase
MAGIVGAFPALNARPPALLGEWLGTIREELDRFAAAHPGRPVAPFAVNQMVHPSNNRLDGDMGLCVAHRVPIVITSLSKPTGIVGRVHGYGGLVFHDVISVRHARKAVDAGVDGLILVCAGAGGHTGVLNPFAFVGEVRRFWDGPIVLSGAIGDGRAVLAAQAAGADLAYVGTRFIATREANAQDAHKRMLVEAGADDIVCTDAVTGVRANYLRASFDALGIDPDGLPAHRKGRLDLAGGGSDAKAWRDIWGAGQGVGGIDDVPTAAACIARLAREYRAARAEMAALPSAA